MFNASSSAHHALADCGQALAAGFFTQIGWIFYFVQPDHSSFERHEDVPNYEVAIFPAISLLLGLEQLARIFRGRRTSKINDVTINLGAGFLFIIVRVLLLSTVLRLFYWIHSFRIVDLPVNSLSTWLISLLLVEFVYYWVHRSLHEINLLWASHQFHHNATELDVSTTLRDTLVDLVVYEFFPAPLALVVPPTVLLVHMQFSLIYQVKSAAIWLHTEVVTKLGFLEYIVNTPAQHRVHHGKNPHCIDKNFGALIMVWDRIFGTYQSDDKEQLVFGTTTAPFKTFDSLTLHFYYYYSHVWPKFKKQNSLGNKLRALFFGPAWSPGKPRTGLESDLLPVDQHEHFDRHEPHAPFWQQHYVMVHGSIIAFCFYILTDHPVIRYSPLNATLWLFYVLFALTAFGCIFDRRTCAPIIEAVRCCLFFVFDYFLVGGWLREAGKWRGSLELVLFLVRLLHVASLFGWLLHYFSDRRTRRDDLEKYVGWTRTQKLVVFVTLLFGILFIWMAFAVQLDACASLLVEERRVLVH